MRTPKYRKHGSRDLGLVEFRGRRYMLPGRHNSVESVNAYRAFLRTHVFCDAKPLAVPGTKGVLSLAELVAVFLDEADERYDSDSRSELGNLRASLLPLVLKFGAMPASMFGPLTLRKYQAALVADGNSRRYINWKIARVRRCFRWGVSRELVPVAVFEALKTVEPLKVGQTTAKERKARKPVPWEHVEPILALLTPAVSTIVQLQWLTGCRCKSLCNAKGEQFDRSQQPWLWRPQHKRENFGTELVLPIGPKAQALLLPILKRKKPGEFLFSPRDVRRNRRYRKRYGTQSICQAIERAVKVANDDRNEDQQIPLWTPHQLRHAKGHATREAYGIEAAQAILGHESLDSTEIYSARRLELAKKVARETG